MLTMKCKFYPDYRSSRAKVKNEQTCGYNEFKLYNFRRPRGNARKYIIGIVGRGNGDKLNVDKYVSRLSRHVELQSNASISVLFLFAVYFIYSRANFPICSPIDLQNTRHKQRSLKVRKVDPRKACPFSAWTAARNCVASTTASRKREESRQCYALFEIVINGGNRKLHGLTSIWAAFIYGFTMLTGEVHRLVVASIRRLPLGLRSLSWSIYGFGHRRLRTVLVRGRSPDGNSANKTRIERPFVVVDCLCRMQFKKRLKIIPHQTSLGIASSPPTERARKQTNKFS
ncbi:conserved hypothetical protein [Trichinella spiralis]|uniref:hypothetical protein n=1 Tax=Trichinella spiralis TaxID=6334 RepID=UPI0001EFC51A|nr:conserved hypothetical protein [Trichinella spiralis]